MDILLALNAEGKTVIVVTHDPKIKSMAQRVIEL
jgi:putative ABC transport system ATP-binding protein